MGVLRVKIAGNWVDAPPIGSQGPGMPPGGASLDRLAKASNADYDLKWLAPYPSTSFRSSVNNVRFPITCQMSMSNAPLLSGAIRAQRAVLDQSYTDNLGVEVVTAATGALLTIGVYYCKADGTPGERAMITSALSGATTGVKAGGGGSLSNGYYWFAVLHTAGASTVSLRGSSSPPPYHVQASTTLASYMAVCWELTGQSSLPNPWPAGALDTTIMPIISGLNSGV